MPNPRLELRDITKRYGTLIANDRVALSVMPGEIHALLGENGAGKSTLMKVAFGATHADSGEILWEGQPLKLANPQAARAHGLAMVYQHFALFETLTVAENIALGLPAAEVKAHGADFPTRIADTAKKYGLDLNPLQPVHTLSVGERQRVEVVRALLGKPRLLILDEPTSVLTPQAVETLFVTLRHLASEGCSILYISHKLDEIRALCQSATVMRGGKVVATCDPREESAASLSRMMIGSAPPAISLPSVALQGVALSVRQLNLARSHAFGTDLVDVSLAVHSGEIVGIAGVSGNGQQALIAALSGEDTRLIAGEIMMGGQRVADQGASLSATSRRKLGFAFVPEERLGRGAVPAMALARNTVLSHQSSPVVHRGLINAKSTEALASRIIDRFKVKASGPEANAKSLSGGNLQKFIVGREIERDPKIFLVAQPTWGVDVGAASQIHAELIALRAKGCAILLISEELDELMALCDRLYVMAGGKLSPSLSRAEATRETVGLWMSGLWQNQTEAARA